MRCRCCCKKPLILFACTRTHTTATPCVSVWLGEGVCGGHQQYAYPVQGVRSGAEAPLRVCVGGWVGRGRGGGTSSMLTPCRG